MLVLLVVALTTGCTSTNASDPDAVPVTNETPVVTTPSVSQIVQGRVTDGTGTPVSEAIVIAEGPGAPEMAAITNEKGIFLGFAGRNLHAYGNKRWVQLAVYDDCSDSRANACPGFCSHTCP